MISFSSREESWVRRVGSSPCARSWDVVRRPTRRKRSTSSGSIPRPSTVTVASRRPTKRSNTLVSRLARLPPRPTRNKRSLFVSAEIVIFFAVNFTLAEDGDAKRARNSSAGTQRGRWSGVLHSQSALVVFTLSNFSRVDCDSGAQGRQHGPAWLS